MLPWSLQRRAREVRASGEISRYSAEAAVRPVSELLADLLDKSGYEKMLRTEGSQERLDNLAELRQSIYEYETTCGEEATLEHYLSHVALFSNADADSGKDAVRLMTVHTAKGLEFPYVFLCQLNDGVFPSKKVRTLEAMEEERRLAFVAMTRAERRLYLSEAEGRNLDGSPKYPSRFLLDIDPALLTFDPEPPAGLYEEARGYVERSWVTLDRQDAPAPFAAGDRVLHPVFGAGTVLELDRDLGAYVICFDAMETPRTIRFQVKLRPL